MSPYLSVVVCTLNRYDELRTCLAALDPAIQGDDTRYEVIVIDQTDGDAWQDIAQEFKYAVHVTQKATGLSVARNLGIVEATGSVIAFLDDDAIANPHWVRAMATAFSDPRNESYLAVGGAVFADYRHGVRPIWLTPQLETYLSCVNWSDRARALAPGEWIVGANMAFRRDVFDQHGIFNVALGRKGTSHLLSNEESVLLTAIGEGRILYSPEAWVDHVIPTSRMDQSWFRKRVYWQAVSDLIADSVYMDAAVARGNIGKFLAASAAELRTLRAFFIDCDEFALLELQLKAIYGLAILGAAGFQEVFAFGERAA